MTQFSAWLKQVASGLPDDIAESVHDEYTAHYEDASDDLMTQGLSQIEAQNKAIEQLGDADKISRRLKDVHIGRATYISAMYASMVLFLLYSTSHMLYVALELQEGSLGSRLFMSGVELMLVSFSLYILFGVRRLLEWRYDAPTLKMVLLFIAVGMIWQSVGVVVSRSIYDYGSHDESIRTISEYTSALDLFLLISRVFGRTMMGVGLMIFGLRVQQVDDPMYGLRNLLGVGVMFMGFCAATFGLFINLHLLALAELVSIGMIFGHVIIWPLAILLFFRAVYRNPIRQPIQTA